MQPIATCSVCGVKTREPFTMRGVQYCARCMEDIYPDWVENRAKKNLKEARRTWGWK